MSTHLPARTQYLLSPTFTEADIAKLDTVTKPIRCFAGLAEYFPGFCGLNNVKATDYVNVVVQALVHVEPLRDFLLLHHDTKVSPARRLARHTRHNASLAATARTQHTPPFPTSACRLTPANTTAAAQRPALPPLLAALQEDVEQQELQTAGFPARTRSGIHGASECRHTAASSSLRTSPRHRHLLPPARLLLEHSTAPPRCTALCQRCSFQHKHTVSFFADCAPTHWLSQHAPQCHTCKTFAPIGITQFNSETFTPIGIAQHNTGTFTRTTTSPRGTHTPRQSVQFDSHKRFMITAQSDPVELLQWVLNTLNIQLRTKRQPSMHVPHHTPRHPLPAAQASSRRPSRASCASPR